jgi:hypothetical protein
MLKRHFRPLRSAQGSVRWMRVVTRASVGIESKGYSPALRSLLVTQAYAGYNGILWDLMGYGWEMPEICGFYAQL